jgi:tetratricopeptide (TPR) repeat protein
MIAVVETNLGDSCLALGRFQHALQYLEQGYGRLEPLELSSRLAECGLRLARLWTKLDNPQQALHYLEKVREAAGKVDHVSALLAYYFRLAEFHNDQLEAQAAHDCLIAALDLAQSQENERMIALCHRQLAKTYVQEGQFEAAVEQLTLAERVANALGLRHEQAACLLIWGEIFRQRGQLDEAQAAWEEAGRLSRRLIPDLNWQAAAAMAELAETADQKEAALAH